MRKGRALPRMILAGTGAAAAAMLLQGAGPKEPRPDPAAVRLYLDRLEAEQRAMAGEASDPRERARQEQLRKLVEGAVVRAPSDAVLSGIEAKVEARLAG